MALFSACWDTLFQTAKRLKNAFCLNTVQKTRVITIGYVVMVVCSAAWAQRRAVDQFASAGRGRGVERVRE